MDEHRLEELLDGHFAERLSEEERAELMLMLEDHPAAREQLAEAARFDVELGRELGRGLPEVPAVGGGRPGLRILGLAAAILLVVSLSMTLFDWGGVEEPDEPNAPGVAIETTNGATLRLGSTTITFIGAASYARLPAASDEGMLFRNQVDNFSKYHLC